MSNANRAKAHVDERLSAQNRTTTEAHPTPMTGERTMSESGRDTGCDAPRTSVADRSGIADALYHFGRSARAVRAIAGGTSETS